MAKKPVVKKAKKKMVTSKKVTSAKATKKVVKKVKAKSKATKKVSFIPKGHIAITPYMIVDNGSKAIDFYKKVFGAKEMFRMDRPDGKVGHAELKIGDGKIMLANECPERGARTPQALGGSPVSIHFYTKDVDATVKLAVSNGAKLMRPVENMFYGDRSGTLTDPFGHTWHVSTHIEDVSAAKMKKRSAELFGNKK